MVGRVRRVRRMNGVSRVFHVRRVSRFDIYTILGPSYITGLGNYGGGGLW
jgi:hypothetical protein